MKRPKPRVKVHYPKGRRPQLVYDDGIRVQRVSAKSTEPELIEAERQELEARLVLGLVREKKRKPGDVTWGEFVKAYHLGRLAYLKPRARDSADSRLAVVAAVAGPVHLKDMVNRDVLEKLKRDLLAGIGNGPEPSKYKPRSAFTVKGIMGGLFSALKWAAQRGMIQGIPEIEPVRTAKLRAMRGRPLTEKEYQDMLRVLPKVIHPAPITDKNRDKARRKIESWLFVMQGLWASGLRLTELMSLSWDDPTQIVPQLDDPPSLHIPAARQKNFSEEQVPILPEFAELLASVPESHRQGWVFNPEPLKGRWGSMRSKWDAVGKTITKIGKKAEIEVRKFPRKKYASAHDLRRSVAQRLVDAGVSIYTVQAVMRHADFRTTQRHYGGQTVARAAAELSQRMKTG